MHRITSHVRTSSHSCKLYQAQKKWAAETMSHGPLPNHTDFVHHTRDQPSTHNRHTKSTLCALKHEFTTQRSNMLYIFSLWKICLPYTVNPSTYSCIIGKQILDKKLFPQQMSQKVSSGDGDVGPWENAYLTCLRVGIWPLELENATALLKDSFQHIHSTIIWVRQLW